MVKHTVTPFFIPDKLGQLFALHYSPTSGNASRCIVHVPAFAEEMNKSRHMIAMQARSFAEQGYSVLIFDLWGTGDSQGEFSEATWSIWLDNIQTVIEWVRSQEIREINFWGLRSGVLLALDFLQKYDCKVEHVLAWQPVLNGEQFIMQFLRLRVAATMMDKNAQQVKTSDLKKQLLAGNSVEVAGYLLNPELINPVLVLKAGIIELSRLKNCSVYELVASNGSSASHACVKWIEQLSELEVDISLTVVQGSAFWSTQEITEVPKLIEETSIKVSEWS